MTFENLEKEFKYINSNSPLFVFSERELMFTFAICCRPSGCLSSVCRL